jgi:hypothetical protein
MLNANKIKRLNANELMISKSAEREESLNSKINRTVFKVL